MTGPTRDAERRGSLLAIDGDSLAHRAYHGIPRAVHLNAVLGFTNFLLHLYDSEDRKSTRLNSSHMSESRMPSSA